jgi:threonine dehydrogenase-like Zn-dependent dehydrogenase
MKAVTWQGKRNISVDEVPDPVIQEPTDAIIKITSTNICGSDLHLYEVFGPFMGKGDILGHEPMGIVQEVGDKVANIKPGDRVVIPFNISCGHCFMCSKGFQSQCETTQVRDQGKGAALLGFSKLYGQVPGGQAEFLRVPHADYGPIKVPEGPADDRFVYLSDVLPTAWQAVQYAAIPEGGSVTIFGLGPIGDMAARIAKLQGAKMVIGVDLVPERLERARKNGFTVIDLNEVEDDDIADAIKSHTDGRGSDAAIDAVGLEAHGSPFGRFIQNASSLLPDAAAAKLFEKGGVDRMNALYHCIDAVRRGGTISIVGVYGGMNDPMPMDSLFDKQITMRMGQANVKRWVDDIMPLLTDQDPLGVDNFATHHLKLDDAPEAYEKFQKKEDGMIKIVLHP